MIAGEKPEDEASPDSTRPQVLGDVNLVLTVRKPKMVQKCLFCFQIPRSHMCLSAFYVNLKASQDWSCTVSCTWEFLVMRRFLGRLLPSCFGKKSIYSRENNSPTDPLMSQKYPSDPWLFKSQEQLRTGQYHLPRLQWLKLVQHWSPTLPSTPLCHQKEE